LFWRKDAQPVWRDPALLTEPACAYGHPRELARRFAGMFAKALGLDARQVQPAFDDGLHYLLRAAGIPLHLDPAQAALVDPRERRALAEKLSRTGAAHGLRTAIGLEREARSLAVHALGVPPRPLVSGARRVAGGPAAATGFTALGGAGRA
jgi:hypothetical protein